MCTNTGYTGILIVRSKPLEKELDMNTTYKIGQDVIANTEAQGLTKGRQYRIAQVNVDKSAWNGTFVTYVIEPSFGGGRSVQVRNGHLILSEV